MPMPADVRAKIKPGFSSPRALATETVGKIIAAVTKYGYTNQDQAKEYIGTLGWEIIKMQGGWPEVCRRLGDELPVGVAQAQWINLGEALIEGGRVGREEPKAIVENRVTSGFSTLGDALIKALPGLKAAK